MNDNPAEFKNQFLLKPFVTKVFEVSPCGTVGLFERVDAIMSREEFLSVADDIFALITKFFVGKYVIDDFGTWYFLNWGIRKNGAGLVLLDFPYVYELDGNKLYCNAPIDPFHRDIKCGGQLDYDDGFNNLICTRCGKHYQARDLAKAEKDQLIIVGGKKTMKVKVKVGSEVILDSSKQKVAKVIEPEPAYEGTMKVKKPIQPVVPDIDVQKPRDAIFHREEEKTIENVAVEPVKEEIKEHVVQEQFKLDEVDNSMVETGSNEEHSGNEELPEEVEEATEESVETGLGPEMTIEEELDKMQEEIDSMEEDVEEYEQFLSNRDRSNIRKANKQQKKSNNDFGEF